MKTSLQLKLGQQLAMTPQLQQAIRLLQLSTLDLQQEIQEALDANPLLELDETSNEATPNAEETKPDGQENSEVSAQESDSGNDPEPFDTSEVIEQREMPEELPVDTT